MDTILATVNSETMCAIICKHKIYGEGKITKIRCSENMGKPEIMLSFESEAKNAVLAYTIVTQRRLLTLDATDQETLDNLMAEYGANWYEFDQKRKDELRAKQEAAKAQKEKEKQEAEEAKKLEAMQLRLERLQPENLTTLCGTPATEYETIGWLAKHIKSLKPFMPFEAKSWFESKFGPVECAKIYERGAKTSGKHPMKYTLSIHGSFDAELPAVLKSKASATSSKAIDSVEFFWSLVDRFDFQFGKKQDVDKIKKNIPTTYLPEFERGFAM